jgi:hypothetical protein
MKEIKEYLRKYRPIAKKYGRKILTVIIVILVLEIAVFGYLSLGKSHAQKSVKAEYDASSAMLEGLLNPDFANETKIHRDELTKANIVAFEAGKKLNISLEPTQIFRRLYSIAAAVHVSINTITSSVVTLQEISGSPFNMLPLNLNVQGTIEDINGFISTISGDYPTATIDFVSVNPDSIGNSRVMSAGMGINIYSFGGSVNE